MVHRIERCWIVEQFDLTDLEDQLQKIVHEEVSAAYKEGLKDSNGKGQSREARAFQTFPARQFLARWFSNC